MDVKKLLENYGITQQEIADFTGIPRARIQKWIEKNTPPPKAHDLKVMELSATFFASMPKEDVKKAVKLYRVFMNNIELIENVPVARQESDESALNSSPDKNTGNTTMSKEDRLFRMAEKMANSIELDAQTRQIEAHTKAELAKTMSWLRELADERKPGLMVK